MAYNGWMRKYWALARGELLDSLQEKGEIVVWLIIEMIPIIVMGSLWINNPNQNGILSTKQLVTYYFVVLITSRLTDFWFDNYMQENIRTGSFSKWLLKPIRTPFMFIPDNLGSKMFSIPFTLIPLIAILGLIFRDFLIVPDMKVFLWFGLALFATYAIKFSLSLITATMAFYWEQSRAALHARWVAEIVFGGYALPLSFYPDWLAWIPNSLPFKYIFYIPASIYNEVLIGSQIGEALSGGAIWSVVLLAASFWFWKKGIRKYSAVGG